MTTERLRAELLLILSPVRERRIWRCLSRDDNERKAGPLFLARQRSFAENRTKAGWRSPDRHPAISVSGAHRHLGNPLFPGKRSLTSRRSIVPLFGPVPRTSDYLCWLVNRTFKTEMV